MAFSQQIVEAVIRLKGEGKTEVAIAAELGLTKSRVRHICYSRVIKKPNTGRFDVVLGPRLIEMYRQEAVKRGITVYTLTQRMLRMIGQADLFNAVLDDDK